MARTRHRLIIPAFSEVPWSCSLSARDDVRHPVPVLNSAVCYPCPEFSCSRRSLHVPFGYQLSILIFVVISAFATPITVRADVVINEIFMVPDSGPCSCGMPGCEPIFPLMEYVEVWNRGPGTANLGNWWICDQPTSMNYFRLRQIPQGSGMPFSPAIVLAEGDFLVIKFGCQVPFPGYSTQANASGTITHTTTLPLPVTSDLQIGQTNFRSGTTRRPAIPIFLRLTSPSSYATLWRGRWAACMSAPNEAAWRLIQSQTSGPRKSLGIARPLCRRRNSSRWTAARYRWSPETVSTIPAAPRMIRRTTSSRRRLRAKRT